jgi:hypothetical protein
MKVLKEHALFIFVFISCALLRFIPLFDYQFTYDELSGLTRTQFTSFTEVIEKGVKIDAHPAFVQLVIYYLTRFFGYVNWIVKLPFLLFSLGAVIYAYAFGLRNFSKQAGLFMSLVFGFSLIFIFYAPIARMYISGVFFSMALLFYFFEIFFLNRLNRSNYFFLGLFALLSALNQHINSLFAFTVCMSGLFFLNRENRKAYLLTCLITVLCYLPHLGVTLYQLSVPGIGRDVGGWLEAPEFNVIFSFLKTLLGTGRTYVLFAVILLGCFITNKKIGFGKQRAYLLGIFVFNFLVVYFYSVFRSPVFQYSVMLFSATAFIALVCSWINFSNRAAFYISFFILFSTLIYKSYIKKDYLHEAVKTVFEYQFERTVHYKKLYGDKNVYPVFCDADDMMKKIYFDKYQTNFECKISSDSMISNLERVFFKRNPITPGQCPGQDVSSLRLFSEFISGLQSDYLVLASSMPIHHAIVSEHYPYLLENTQTQANNFKLYSKRKEDRNKVVENDKVISYSSLTSVGRFVYPKKTGIIFLKNGFSLPVDSLNEFPFDARAAVNDVVGKEGEVTLVTAKLKLRKKCSAVECCVSLTDPETNKSYSYNAKTVSDFVPSKDSMLTLYSDLFNGTIYNKVRYKANLNCYVWNKGKENFELKDFEIRVIDYWPNKWHFWD